MPPAQSPARPAASPAEVAAIAALAIVLLPVGVHAQAASANADPVAPLAWMAGCWEVRTATRVTEEQWMRPAGSSMLGMSRTVAGGALREWESLRVAVVQGRVTYIATPSGQRETPFAATVVSDTLAAFENPTHDFPQRIAYRRIGNDSLVARISATQGGKERGMDIPMKRVRCGG